MVCRGAAPPHAHCEGGGGAVPVPAPPPVRKDSAPGHPHRAGKQPEGHRAC